MTANLGQIVYSKAGRDKGEFFVVIEVYDNLYVGIADGSLRKIEKPKRKKIMHLYITDKNVNGIGEKIDKKLKITNSELRKGLEAYKVKLLEHQNDIK